MARTRNSTLRSVVSASLFGYVSGLCVLLFQEEFPRFYPATQDLLSFPASAIASALGALIGAVVYLFPLAYLGEPEDIHGASFKVTLIGALLGLTITIMMTSSLPAPAAGPRISLWYDLSGLVNGAVASFSLCRSSRT